MKIYVASSWKNQKFDSVLLALKEWAHLDCYNFREANSAFHWSWIDPKWRHWHPEDFIEALQHQKAQKAFENDFNAMKECDALLLVMPCGNSAHLEAGWFTGQGKPVVILLDNGDPDLMYLLADYVTSDLKDAIDFLDGVPK